MRVLLINPNVALESPWSGKEAVPPIGLMYLGAVLERDNYEVGIIDANWRKLSQIDLSRELVKHRPDIVGITTDSCNFNDSLKVARVAKNVTHAIVIMGGPHATVLPNEVIRYPEVDIVVFGEGEQTLLDVLQRIEEGNSLQGCEGTLFKQDNEVIHNPPRARITNLDELPFPARHLVAFEEYPHKYSFSRIRAPVSTVSTSRGCPFDCSFCSNKVIWGKYVARSPKNVVDEIEYLVNRYGAKGIYFREDNFTVDNKRLLQICEELLRRRVEVEWECSSRVDLVKRDLLREMYKAGCRGIWYGVESGSEKTLKILNKRITKDQSREAIAITKEAGIKVGGSFMIGVPGETMDDINDTLRFVQELNCDHVGIGIFVGIPISRLYDEIVEKRMIDAAYGHILFVKTDQFDRRTLEEITRDFHRVTELGTCQRLLPWQQVISKLPRSLVIWGSWVRNVGSRGWRL